MKKKAPLTQFPATLRSAVTAAIKTKRARRGWFGALGVMPVGLVVAGGLQAQGFPAQFDLSSLDGSNGFVLTGIDAGDNSGDSVSGAGDINGDGLDDLVIGAEKADPNGLEDAGESYVVFGSSAGFGASLDLSSLNGINGFVLNGIAAGDVTGGAVSDAGDVNGDGLDDFLISARGANPNGLDNAGKTYVVFGSNSGFASPFELSSLTGSNGFAVNGVDARDLSGRSVSGAGDVNGDDIDDIVIGARDADPNGGYSGESYVVFGSSTGFGASLELSLLNGSNGVVLNGIGSNDKSGLSVSGAGDINGDGLNDVVIGTYLGDPNGQDSGESYLVFGRSSGFSASLEMSALDGSDGFVINGVDANDHSGHNVSDAGDINGDGIDDLLIGADRADPNGRNTAGESYVVFGTRSGFGASFELSSLDGSNGFVLQGVTPFDFSGLAGSSAGDINGDGVDDLIIGADRADPNGNTQAGESYVVFGSTAGFNATIDLSLLNGNDGFILNGIDVDDRSGVTVSGAGDINGDGIDDLVIGAERADPNGNSEAGESYVVYGRCVPRLNLVQDQWHLFGPPCDPGGATVETVFVTNGTLLAGEYYDAGTDTGTWVVYRRDTTADADVQLALTDPIQTGVGYWVRSTTAGQSATLSGTPDAASTQVTLTGDPAGRFNLVSHPDNRPVEWRDVRVIDPGQGTLTLEQADPDGVCQGPDPVLNGCVMSAVMHQWNGSAYQAFNGSTLNMEGRLKSLDGFRVNAFVDGLALEIPASSATSRAPRSSRAPAGVAPGWQIQLSVSASHNGGTRYDGGNYFGQLSDSVDEYDINDLPEPEPFGSSYLTVVFPQADWQGYEGTYTSDHRQINDHGDGLWNFEVRTGLPVGTEVTLSWAGPDDAVERAALLDYTGNAKIRAAVDGSYIFTVTGPVHEFGWLQRPWRYYRGGSQKKLKPGSAKR